MKKTFVCNETMIITIPMGSLKDGNDGQLMPEKFRCVYKDYYKLFAIKGKPKPLGAAQAIAGVFIVTLGLMFLDRGFPLNILMLIYTQPSFLFVVTGMLTYAAGRSPNIHVAKLSFSLNIISFLWAIIAVILCAIILHFHHEERRYNPNMEKLKFSQFLYGINCLILTLLLAEKLIALFLIYWLSKAVCREHFNTLPTILLKHGD